MRPTKKKGSKAVAKPLPIEVNYAEFTSIMKSTLSMHHKIAFLLAWGSGLRISEVINLKQADFNFEEKTIRVNMGKNSKDRIVPMAPHFEKEHLKHIPIPCKQRSLQKAFKLYAEKSGVLARKPRVHFHSLRHGFATHCLRSGINLIDIQGHLGHEDVSTTAIYTNVAPVERINNFQEKFRP